MVGRQGEKERKKKGQTVLVNYAKPVRNATN